jgi:hypothetical protein
MQVDAEAAARYRYEANELRRLADDHGLRCAAEPYQHRDRIRSFVLRFAS